MNIQITTQTSASAADVLNTIFTRGNLTYEIARDIQKRMAQVIMPWAEDGSAPPRLVRKTGTGEIVGTVDSHLAGFGDAHLPRHNGWGYKANTSTGYGVCTSGIVKVDTVGIVLNAPENQDVIKQRELDARVKAQVLVDEWLEGEFPFFTILEKLS